MWLPYARPRLLEICDQPWCPVYVRQPIQQMLTFLWLHRIPPFQLRAPYEPVVDILDRIIADVEQEDRELDEDRQIRIVDCCSGGGGPMALIERKLNRRRSDRSEPAIPVVLSDLHPHTSEWQRLSASSFNKALSYLPYPVDATIAPAEVKAERHFRSFCLSFHHFSEDAATRVLEDAMRTAEGICIFELQEPTFGSIFTILCLFPLCMLLMPFQHPTRRTLFLTYILPLIPFVLTLDGLVSAWRTRSFPHIMHLADQAAMRVNLEGADGDHVEWKWEHGRGRHTWPSGEMFWVIGRRERVSEEATLPAVASAWRGVVSSTWGMFRSKKD